MSTLKAKSTAANEASVAAENARIARDQLFYNTPSCLLEVAQKVKKYVKSALGADHPQYLAINEIKFRRYK